MTTRLAGFAAGVPFVAVGPAPDSTAPVVVSWHLMDSPRSEAAFAAAVPLAGLSAWRIYLGLPMVRCPAAGRRLDELMRLAFDDAVLKLQGPIATQGAQEFPAVWAELRQQLDLGDGPLGLMGGSIGGAIVQLVLTETAPAAGIPVAAAVLINPVTQLTAAVEANGRQFAVTYEWKPEALDLAARLDFVARADDFVAAGQPAVRIVIGAEDDQDGFGIPAKRLQAALIDRYDTPDRADLQVIPGLGRVG